MRRFLSFVIIFFMVFFINCATEQEAIQASNILKDKCDAPIWNVGDYWRHRYSNMKEWQYTVERIEEDSYVVDDYGVKKYFDKKTLGLVAENDTKGVRKRVDSIQFIDFPIHVGKKWKKTFTAIPGGSLSNLNINYLNEYKVISYKDVTAPAGTFKAFKIELNQTNYGGRFDSGKFYFWYSPEVKSIVKNEYEDIAYWRVYRNSALIKFELKDKGLPTPELKLSPQKVDTTPKPQTPLPETPKISAPATPPPRTNFVTVSGTSANIRSGAGNEFSIVTIVKQGDKLTFLGEYGEWFNVRLENGQEGWINSRFVKE